MVYPGISIVNYKGATSGHPYLTMNNAAGTSTAPTALTNSLLGSLIFTGYDGTSFVQSARIEAAPEAPFSVGNNLTSLIFSTGSGGVYNQRMKITSSGNVGIGTLAPTLNTSGKVIHVHEGSTGASAIHFTNNTTGAAAANGFVMGRWMDGSYGDGIILWNYDSTPMTFATAAIARMYINGINGNVGVGTTSPLSKFEVSGLQPVLRVVSDTGNVDNNYLTRFMNQDNISEGGHIEFKGAASYQDIVIDNVSGTMRFFEPTQSRLAIKNRGGYSWMTNTSITGIPNLTEKMVLTNAGYVGIGTTAPNANLHVYANTAGRSMIRAEATSENAYLVLDRTGDNATIVNKNDGTLRINHSGNSTDAHIVISNTGNVGIGTTSPGAKLHVSGGDLYVTDQTINNYSTSRSAFMLRTDNITPASDNGIRFYDGNSNGHLHIGNLGASYIQSYGTASFGPGTLGTSTLDLDDNINFSAIALNPLGGNVGIGTSSPVAKLEVQGSVKIVDGTQGAGKELISDAGGLASWQNTDAQNAINAANVSRGALPVGANCPAAGSYTTAGVTLQPGIYMYILYSCAGQLGVAGGPGFNVSQVFLSGAGTATSTFHDFVNSISCGNYYTGVVKVTSVASIATVYGSYGGSTFTVPGANAESCLYIRIN